MISIRPCNWNQFQHYTHRRPPWIKLHRELLDDFQWHALPIASKALAPSLWLLASEHKEGLIMGEEIEISFRLRVSIQELEDAINSLKERGFFEDASGVLAMRLQDATSESERETETDQMRRKRAASAPEGAQPVAKITSKEEWAKRIDGYDPQNQRKTWKPFWGPPPDSLERNGFAPPELFSAWRASHSIKLSTGLTA